MWSPFPPVGLLYVKPPPPFITDPEAVENALRGTCEGIFADAESCGITDTEAIDAEQFKKLYVRRKHRHKWEIPMGMPDTGDDTMAAGQVGFIGFVARPLFVLLAEFYPECQHVLDQLDANVEKWRATDAKVKERRQQEAAAAEAAKKADEDAQAQADVEGDNTSADIPASDDALADGTASGESGDKEENPVLSADDQS